VSDQIHEQELPGIGRRYSVQAEGGEVSVVIHHSGRRDIYLGDATGRTPPAVATLSDDQARRLGAVEHRVVRVDLAQFGGSALTDTNISVPDQGVKAGIPTTYVPARNTNLLSLALAWAEVLEAQHIFVGANAVDYSGYPDCRPEYMRAFEALANLATRASVEGRRFTLHTPIIDLGKAEAVLPQREQVPDFEAAKTRPRDDHDADQPGQHRQPAPPPRPLAEQRSGDGG